MLAQERRFPQALELLAGFVSHLPASSARNDVLFAAGKIAERAARGLPSGAAGRFARAGKLLGAPIFAGRTALRYQGAFEALVDGEGPVAEQAALRLIPLAAPCTPDDVAQRSVDFLVKYPESAFVQEARLWQARALEEAFWKGRVRGLAVRAMAAYRAAAQLDGPGKQEAEARIRALGARKPTRDGSVRVCR